MKVPPKTVVHSLRRHTENLQPVTPQSKTPPSVSSLPELDAQAAEQVMAFRSPGAVGRPKESLPVLEAFQEFLAAERRRTQRRLATLAVFFIVIFVACLGGAITIGLMFYKQMQRDFEDVQAHMTSQKGYANTPETRAAFQKIEQRTRQLEASIEKERQTIARTTEDAARRSKQYDEHLARMQHVIRGLESQNKGLKTDLAVLKKEWPDLTNEIGTAMQAMSETQPSQSPRPVAPPRDVADTALPLPPPLPGPTAIVESAPLESPADIEPSLPERTPSVEISIVPRGQRKAVNWRLPIPE